MSHVTRKPMLCHMRTTKHRSFCVSAQSDQRIYCSLSRKYNPYSSYTRNFKTLSSFRSWADRFGSFLVAYLRRQVFLWRGSHAFLPDNEFSGLFRETNWLFGWVVASKTNHTEFRSRGSNVLHKWCQVDLTKRGCPFRGIPVPYHFFYFFAGEQFNMCTLLWHTSACAEAGLFSSYKVLNVGVVIQYATDEYIVNYFSPFHMCCSIAIVT